MSANLIQRSDLSRFTYHGIGNYHHFQRTISLPIMNVNLSTPQSGTKENDTVKLQNSSVHQLRTCRPSDIHFDRLQPLNQECHGVHRVEFGKFMAREAVIDEEYWAAAWLRAESHWEDRPSERYIDNFKRKFADQEFNALKRRCSGQHIQLSTCIVAVKKKDKNVKCTILKSVVGTLDLSIRYLLQGETFPGECVKPPIFSSINRTNSQKYGYVANLCVTKSARRQGIASNMLSLAIESAKTKGVEQIFVHVYRENAAAMELYLNMGFQIVEIATPHLLAEEKYLLCFKT